MDASRIAQIARNAKLEKHQQFLLDIQKEAPVLLQNVLAEIEKSARRGADECWFDEMHPMFRQLENHLRFGSVKNDLQKLGFRLKQGSNNKDPFYGPLGYENIVIAWGDSPQNAPEPKSDLFHVVTWNIVFWVLCIGCAVGIMMLVLNNGFH